jgi:hypothetical protein
MLRRTNYERTIDSRLRIIGTTTYRHSCRCEPIVSFGGCKARPLACLGPFATIKEDGKRVPRQLKLRSGATDL